jgi:hypothetical protein
MYVATISDSTADGQYDYSRVSQISNVELGVAFGAVPATIAVTTDAGTEQWRGIEWTTRPSSPQPTIANFLIAYRDSDIHTSLIMGYDSYHGSLALAVLVVNDSVRIGSSQEDGTSQVTLETSQPCAPPPPLANPTIANVSPQSCIHAVFESSASIDFIPEQHVPGAPRHLSFAATTFQGVRF